LCIAAPRLSAESSQGIRGPQDVCCFGFFSLAADFGFGSAVRLAVGFDFGFAVGFCFFD
jgi:hypothetical protein